jgi:hypothetical protein
MVRPARQRASQRHEMGVAIHASLGLRGDDPFSLHLHQVRAAMHFLDLATLTIHVSLGQHHLERVAARRLESMQAAHAGTLLINPRHLAVRSGSSSIMGAHLANWMLLERRHKLLPNDKYVLLAANVFLFRPCAAFVRAHSLSFMKAELTDAHVNEADVRSIASQLHAGLSAFPASDRWRMMMKDVAMRRDDDVRVRSQSRTFRNMLSRTGFGSRDSSGLLYLGNDSASATWHRAPYALMPHEGSFYPVWLMRNFVANLTGGPFEPEQLMNNSAPGCVWFPPFNGCAYEEFLLPTFVWQHHYQLAVDAASPIFAARIWLPRKNTLDLSLLLATFNDSVFLGDRPHLCAIKVPNSGSAAEQTFLRQLQPIVPLTDYGLRERFVTDRATLPIGGTP